MKTIDAIETIEKAGYTVRFTDGTWLVTLWTGCVERLTRLELVTLAKDLVYLEG